MAKKNKTKNTAACITDKDLLKAYTLLLAARGMGITDNNANTIGAAKGIIDQRVIDFSIVMDYLTTKKN